MDDQVTNKNLVERLLSEINFGDRVKITARNSKGVVRYLTGYVAEKMSWGNIWLSRHDPSTDFYWRALRFTFQYTPVPYGSIIGFEKI